MYINSNKKYKNYKKGGQNLMDAAYIHIPFCHSLCKYCDFLSFNGVNKSEQEIYVDYLLKEINIYRKSGFLTKKLNTVYFGGGTPSILEPEQINKILKSLPLEEECEITLEVNPRTVTLDKLKELKNIGINRLSIGIQTFNNEMLKILGRPHTSEEGIETYFLGRKAGFSNISLDLMFSLPGETEEMLGEDLDRLFELNPEHFSIYSLIWEEGTPFNDMLKAGVYSETENELEAQMFKDIIEKSKKHNYIHYEISNFSKEGNESKHNMKYWENKEYLGLGLGASGYLENKRYKNHENFDEYYKKINEMDFPQQDIEIVTDQEHEVYKNILGLRILTKGVVPCNADIEIFKKLEEEGYLKKENKNYRLTEQGLFFANDVFERLI